MFKVVEALGILSGLVLALAVALFTLALAIAGGLSISNTIFGLIGGVGVGGLLASQVLIVAYKAIKTGMGA